ncbi:hypothetical protein SBI_01192 [Streptomyces bingchenggensis BCW-1]|uniref:Uncharacterized protein n=1 Tax=Streptomyces bingchenggensis (strain BCW-1) TaxID=749414 RepID=D7C9Y5_STRBB|nr:hypothetical protein SBI_01192 [Streptomyces bingchenggensis BCW-1]
MTRFFAAWATQDAVGCVVAPRIRIRRLLCSITTSTYIRVPERVTVSMKSQASRASAWVRRKLAQVLEFRSGAGSMPASFRISQTVDAPTFTPSTRSSPCRRRYPQLGFSFARRSTRMRIERTVGGRPGCLGRQEAAWRRATRLRCQRSTVSGRTSSRDPRRTGGGSRCRSAARNARSLGVNRIFSLPSWRSSTVIWWRRARISASLSRSVIGSRRSIANAFDTPK